MSNVKWLLSGLFAIIFGSLIASVIQSQSGEISIRNLLVEGHHGIPISVRLFVPPNATPANPAPAVVTVHGYVNQKEVMSNFNIELARRGYVVLSMDMSGHGATLPISDDASRGAGDVLEFARTLPEVNTAEISIMGHSMGGWSATTAAVDHTAWVHTLIVVGSAQGGHEAGFMLGAPVIPKKAGFNFGVEFGRYDEFVAINYFDQKKAADFTHSHWLMAPFNTDAPVVLNQVYGDFSKGTGRMATQSPETHAGVHQSEIAVGNVLRMLNLSSPAPIQKAVSDQVWGYKELGTAVAYLGLVFFVVSLCRTLLVMAPFRSLVQPMPVRSPLALPLYAVVCLSIIALVANLLVPLQIWAMNNLGANKVFPLLFANTSLFYFGVIQVILLVAFFVWHYARGKKQGETLITYGLSTSTSRSRVELFYVGKAVLLAVFIALSAYALVATIYYVLDVDLRWWMLVLRPMESHRWWSLLAYFPVILLIFLANNFIAFGWLKLKSFGSDFKNSVIWTGAVFGVNSLGVILVISLQMGSLYLAGQPYFGEIGYDTLMVILGNGFIPLFAVTSLLSTYCFRKTGNIYLGAILSACMASWMIVCYQPY